MSNISAINHLESASALLLSQFDASETIQNLMKSWVTPTQDLEDSLIAFMQGNGVSTATGVTLDYIGSWFGLERNGLTDSAFRTIILGQALLFGQDGTTEKFLQALRTITQSDNNTFYDHFPATCYAMSGGSWNSETYRQVQKFKPAGVHLRLLVDHNLDSLKFTEVLEQSNQLIVNTVDNLQAEIGGIVHDIIVSQSGSETLDASGDYPAEVVDDEGVPMAELISANTFERNGQLVDEAGDFITDQAGNIFVVQSLSY